MLGTVTGSPELEVETDACPEVGELLEQCHGLLLRGQVLLVLAELTLQFCVQLLEVLELRDLDLVGVDFRIELRDVALQAGDLCLERLFDIEIDPDPDPDQGHDQHGDLLLQRDSLEGREIWHCYGHASALDRHLESELVDDQAFFGRLTALLQHDVGKEPALLEVSDELHDIVIGQRFAVNGHLRVTVDGCQPDLQGIQALTQSDKQTDRPTLILAKLLDDAVLIFQQPLVLLVILDLLDLLLEGVELLRLALLDLGLERDLIDEHLPAIPAGPHKDQHDPQAHHQLEHRRIDSNFCIFGSSLDREQIDLNNRSPPRRRARPTTTAASGATRDMSSGRCFKAVVSSLLNGLATVVAIPNCSEILLGRLAILEHPPHRTMCAMSSSGEVVRK